MAIPEDPNIISEYGVAAMFRLSDTWDKRRSTENKSDYRTKWPPKEICWIQENCLGLLHKDAVRRIVEHYGVTPGAACAVILRAREEE